MAKGKITGAIAANARVYRAGDEAEFAEYLDGLEPAHRKASLAHLSKYGQVEGFGAPKAAELTEDDPTLAARPEDDDEEHIVAGEPGEVRPPRRRK